MRRHDLDWLRVFAFGLLILYHVGMFFVPWGWHLKNDILYPWLRWPMLFVNQWRLPLLFVISGMGTYYALSRRTAGQFAGERLTRLLVPLVFGILVVVPPQVYLERLDKGQISTGYLGFWPSRLFEGGAYPEGNFSWHHLWFLPYLLLFSLVLMPVLFHLRTQPPGPLLKGMRRLAARPHGLFLLVLPLYLWESLLEPYFESTHALVNDWFNLVNYGTLFLYGYLLISVKEVFWVTVAKHWPTFVLVGVAAFTLLVGIRILHEDSVPVHFIEASFKVINLWAWILALFGAAASYLNRPSRTLRYANEAVYPFYILHQTITLALGYPLRQLDWGFLPEFLVMTAGTLGGSWVVYELLIRRWRWVRPLFGLKTTRAIQPRRQARLVRGI